MRQQLFGHQIETARERGWDTLSNGVLLNQAEAVGFEVLLTTDQGIRYQQNMTHRQIAVVVLMNTDWSRISRRTEEIRASLEGIRPGEVREVQI